MSNTGKTFVLVYILTMAISSILALAVLSVGAQSIPSVPQFTAEFVPSFSEVQATTTTNPYTGQNETSPSYSVNHSYIQLTIQNQPSNGYPLYYNVRMKGHFADNWTNIYDPINGQAGQIYPIQSSTNSTIIVYTYHQDINAWVTGNYPGIDLQNLPNNSQFDFQVQAEIGTFTQVPYGHGIILGHSEVFNAQSASGWSNTQTITIPASSTVPEFSLWPLPLLLMISTLAGLLVHLKKQKQVKLNEEE